MEKVEIMDHKGKQIVYIDFSGGPDSVRSTIIKAGEIIQSQPKHSVRTLVDVKDANWDKDAVSALKNLAKNDKDYVIASAVVGITGLKKVLLSAVKRFTGREFVLFDEVTPALDWLSTQ